MTKMREINWHAISEQDVVAALSTNRSVGLSPSEWSLRLKQFGENALPTPKSVGLIQLFIAQFKSPLIYLLLLAATIALVLGHHHDAIIIASLVLINAIIGTLQEGKAKRSLESLRRFNQIEADVIRDGREQKIVASQLVPGDIIKIATGDAIPADARLLLAHVLTTSEAHLTGESTPIMKTEVTVEENARVSERTNMVYAGTYAVAGRGVAVVVATGEQTELGKIAKLSEAVEPEQTPLEAKIARFGKGVLVVAAVVLTSMISVGVMRGIAFGEILVIAISQIVGLIPEGLPVAVTVAQAVAVQRMARKRALTRRLSALETLGSVDVICTDKTGTLTENQMTVTAIATCGRTPIVVTGNGYNPYGDFVEDQQKIDPLHDAQLYKLLLVGALCNDAILTPPKKQYEAWLAVGDPTEIALITVAQKARIDVGVLNENFVREGEIPFDPSMQMMATAHRRSGKSMIAIKGSPEAIIDLCGTASGRDGVVPLDKEERAKLWQTVEALTQQALRVIAVAMVEDATIDKATRFESLRGKAVFLGFLGQIDPPRPSVQQAIARCFSAGIKPVMVTGDHKNTGCAIANNLGMRGDALDGNELERISDDELKQRIDTISVFARVLPEQKLRIVNAYKANHHVVAMTGDGVNDAPALVKADVGVAMGQSGTEVAKEAAKIVITDDNFTTIVSAIEQGRVVYQNIQKAIVLLISTAAAETLILFLAILFGFPPPFNAVQILWINLVTETAIVINLVMDPAEGNEMTTPPIPRFEPLVPRALFARICTMTTAIVLSTLGWFIFRIVTLVPVAQAQTEAFTMLVVCDWFNVLNCRSRLKSAFSMSLLNNVWLLGGLGAGILLQLAVIYWRPLGELFHTKPIALSTALVMVAVASLVLFVEEARKMVSRKVG